MSVLVTGVAGFIGSHVADALVQRGHDVIGLDDLSGGFDENVSKGIKFYSGTILDTQLLEKIFRDHRIEHVFHLAAYAAEGLSHFIRNFNYTNNVVGSMNLINCAVKSEVKCFVFTSSIAVYGAGQTPLSESTIPTPEDPYGIAKFSVELDLKAAHHIFGLNYVIFRPHNVYGERQNIGDRYRNVIGIFMNQIMRGEPMSIFGDGEQTRAFSYVGDVAPQIARSIEVPGAYGEVFNVGADEATSLNVLAKEVAKAMGVKADIKYLDARKEVVNAVADHSKLAKVLGHSAATSLPDGLARMAKWARESGSRAPTVFKNIEVLKNLPPSWKV